MKMQKIERVRGRGRHAARMAVVLGAAFFLLWSHPMVGRAEPTGTVKPSSVNIRKEPSQDSEVIGSTTGGKEISIRGKVDVSGVTWYQVYVQGDTLGYVRADMVEKKGDEDIPTVSAPSSGGGSDASSDGGGEQDAAQAAGGEASSSSAGAQVQAQEEMPGQYASIKVQSAKVRPDPSTSNNPVESIPSGTQVVVSGKSEGSDSKTWYYVTFTGANGSEKTGYIRSDLLELGEMLPVEEPPVEEPPVEEPPVEEPTPNNDYELRIETDSEGQEAWYICDNVTGQKQKLVPLLEASYAQALGNTDDTDAIVKQRIVIVVLAVLLATAVIVIIVMAFKLRDAYYEDYDEDDEDDEDEEESGSRRSARREEEAQERQSRRRTPDEEERKPRRREEGEERSPRRRGDEEERRPRRREEAESAAKGKADRPERRRREVSYEEESEAKETARPAKGRKAKNFLLDDDEFEFEFLNMEDKDLK